MNTTPLIALLPGFTPGEKQTYTVRGYEQGILRAGGFPVTLPLTDRPEILEQAVQTFDGFLFVGGKDLHPHHYGQEVLEHCGLISPEADRMDLALFSKINYLSSEKIIHPATNIAIIINGNENNICNKSKSSYSSNHPGYTVAHLADTGVSFY